jgi:hypothetical protein
MQFAGMMKHDPQRAFRIWLERVGPVESLDELHELYQATYRNTPSKRALVHRLHEVSVEVGPDGALVLPEAWRHG